jgi:uncharacterized protein YkwD
VSISTRRACLGCAAILMIAVLLNALAVEARPPVQAVGTTVYLPMISGSLPSVEQQIVDLTNQQRRSNGCFVDLALSPALSAAGYSHSRDMALNNLFSHTGSDGSTLGDRAVRAGYNYQKLAENIAAGFPTAQAVVTNWMTSASHRANILNCDMREIGVGFYNQPDDQANVRDDTGALGGPYRYYWTQDFGTPQ